MDFFFTDEQRAWRDETVDFARSELGSELLERDRTATFAHEDWLRCAKRGVLGLHVPEVFGGRGADAVTTVLTLEALGYGCRDNGLTLALGGQMWSVQEPIQIYGTDEQKAKYLSRLCSGEWIGVHGVSEELSGSDALALRTTARRVDGGYVLNGRKCYIGMAPLADFALVLANSNPDAGKWGVSAFLVEREAHGFTTSEARAKTGTRTNPLGDLILEDCFVPEENRLGREGVGLSLFTNTIQWERAFIHAGHLGALQFLIDQCVAYSREREQFGRPIGSYQSVSNRIADMRLRQETARLLMYKVAAMKDRSLDAAIECAMAKLHIGESLLASAADAVRIHGARGYLEEFEIERDLRDSIGAVLYAGTSDIQRNLIYDLMK